MSSSSLKDFSRSSHLFFFTAFILLSACSTLKTVHEAESWQLKGKLSVRTEGRTSIVSIRWYQSGSHSDIELRGPFGVTVASIEADGNKLTVRTSEGETRYDDELALSSPEAGAATVKFPWRSLAYWVRGVTGPAGEPIVEGYSVDDWQIRILKEDSLGPRLMVFEHPQASLRLKVQDWKIKVSNKPDHGI